PSPGAPHAPRRPPEERAVRLVRGTLCRRHALWFGYTSCFLRPPHRPSERYVHRTLTGFSHPGIDLLPLVRLGLYPVSSLEDLAVSTTDRTESGAWLSQEAYDRLKAELDELIANRPVIAAEINARREEGDLRENGGYHAAKEEQGKAEARIRYLTDLLRTARVGTPPKSDTVAPGMVV